MAPIAFYNLPAQGHLAPTLPVVSELVRRGETVVYTAAKRDRQAVEATGARFRAYEDLCPGFEFPERLMAAGSIVELGALMMRVTEQLLPRIVEAMQQERPRIVAYDSFALPAKYASRLLQIPSVALVTVQMPATGKGRPFLLPSLRPRILASMAASLVRGLPWLPAHLRAARRLERTYGLSSPGLADMVSRYDTHNIVFTSREFQPGADALDGRFVMVGPALDDRASSPAPPLSGPARAPLVYISLGTLFNKSAGFYRTALAAFRGRPLRVVMSIGPHVDPASLGAIPENVVVSRYVPQLEVLQGASLFVTHGGANSVREALWFGVPMVVFPRGADQFFVAERVEQLNLGVVLWKKNVSAKLLWSGAARVISDTAMRARCVEMGASFRAAGGFVRAADEIQRVARGESGATA